MAPSSYRLHLVLVGALSALVPTGLRAEAPPSGISIELPSSFPRPERRPPAELVAPLASKAVEAAPVAAPSGAAATTPRPAERALAPAEAPQSVIVPPNAAALAEGIGQPRLTAPEAGGLTWQAAPAAPALRPQGRPSPASAANEAQPANSPDLQPAPAVQTAAAQASVSAPSEPKLRPKARPEGLTLAAAAPPVAQLASVASFPTRPKARPRGLAAAAAAQNRRASREVDIAPTQAAVIRPAPGGGAITRDAGRGGLCGMANLSGQMISPIAGRLQGCGVAQPARVTAVSGIRLSQPMTIDCDTARAFSRWVEGGLKPAFGATGGGITEIHIAAHYSCRSRNNKRGAPISEHGRGKGIDVAGITLASGQKLSILRDWRGAHGGKLKAAHRAACGIFGTTLGPGSDGYHEDHLHFDSIARRRPYCR